MPRQAQTKETKQTETKVTLLCNYGDKKPGDVVALKPQDAQNLVKIGWARM